MTARRKLSVYRTLVVEPDGSVRRMTRADCIAGCSNTGSREDRLAGRARCQAFACRQNLDVDHSAEVPGRRHDGIAPPWTFSGRTDASSPSCALDVVDQNPHGMSCEQIAEVMGYDKRRVEQLLEQARSGAAGVELARLFSALSAEIG